METDASPLEHLQWNMSAPHVMPGQHPLVEYEGEVLTRSLSSPARTPRAPHDG